MKNPIVQLGHKVLSFSICYDAFQSSVGAYKFRKEFVLEQLANSRVESVLDLGCGTASTAPLLPKGVQYIGIDTSSSYLQTAAKRCDGLDYELVNSDISGAHWGKEVKLKGQTLSLALGIFHHVNDFELRGTLENLESSLTPGSKVVSLDPIIDRHSSKYATWFASNDRGKFIRSSENYKDLYDEYGFDLKFEVLRNKFRIPYDLIIMQAIKR